MRSRANSEPPFCLQIFHVLPAKVGKAERVGFEPTRRLNTVYTISNLKRAPYLSVHGVLIYPIASVKSGLLRHLARC